jgi:hypothetical protein
VAISWVLARWEKNEGKKKPSEFQGRISSGGRKWNGGGLVRDLLDMWRMGALRNWDEEST